MIKGYHLHQPQASVNWLAASTAGCSWFFVAVVWVFFVLCCFLFVCVCLVWCALSTGK